MNLRIRRTCFALAIGSLAVLMSLAIGAPANAHFVWVYLDGGSAKIVFGEDLEPDQAQFLDGLKEMKTFTVRNGHRESVDPQRMVEGDEGWFELPFGELAESVEVTCPYGLFSRGDTAMNLDYSAKYVRLKSKHFDRPVKPSDKLALDIVPSFVDGRLVVTTYFQGQVLEGAEITLERVETQSVVAITDPSGRVALSPSKRFVIRAKHVLDKPGEVKGESFTEQRFYCTMVLDIASESESSPGSVSNPLNLETGETGRTMLEKIDLHYPEFPKGMTSFGATVMNDRLYVMGGKSGKAHAYAKAYQNRDVLCLQLDRPKPNWDVVGDNLGLQGLAIVAHSGRVYRIGGLEARNDEGEEQDLHSVDTVLAFDPAKSTWDPKPSLPSGRSSFDACVVDDQIFVVGGWTMRGEVASEWASDMLRLDLSNSEAEWESIEAPFQVRAHAVRSHRGKLVVVGGIDRTGPTNAVHFYDLKTGEWTVGPEVPTESEMDAFGCSAVSLGDSFLVSTYDGGIYQLQDAQNWQKIYQLDSGRFFHQMVPVGESTFALVGGSHMEQGSHREIEVFRLVEQPTAISSGQ